jgi:hypothetical protein
MPACVQKSCAHNNFRFVESPSGRKHSRLQESSLSFANAPLHPVCVYLPARVSVIEALGHPLPLVAPSSDGVGEMPHTYPPSSFVVLRCRVLVIPKS